MQIKLRYRYAFKYISLSDLREEQATPVGDKGANNG
jgi:hypothetical protein